MWPLISSFRIQALHPRRFFARRHALLVALLLAAAGVAWPGGRAGLAAMSAAEADAIVDALKEAYWELRDGNPEIVAAISAAAREMDRLAQPPGAAGPGGETDAGRREAGRALIDLKAGKTEAAKTFFQARLTRLRAAGPTAARDAAAAARHLGGLALVRDRKTALPAFRTAIELDPQRADWFGLAEAASSTGNKEEAVHAMHRFIDLSSIAGHDRDAARGHEWLGEMQKFRQDYDAALANLRAALDIRRRLAARAPGDAGLQRDLRNAYMTMAYVAKDKGDVAGMLKSYREALGPAQRLVAQDSGIVSDRNRLASIHQGIGDVLRTQQDFAGALDSYRGEVALRRDLASLDHGDAGRQRDYAKSVSSVGLMLVVQGDYDTAAQRLRSALETGRRAIAQVRNDADAPDYLLAHLQTDQAIYRGYMAEAMVGQDRLGPALKGFGGALDTLVRLVQQDPDNFYARLALIKVLRRYHKLLTALSPIVAETPGTADWQRDMRAGHQQIGDVLLAQDERPGAVANYRAALAIAERLAAEAPGDARLARDRVVVLSRLAALPGSGVRWANVAAVWNEMERRGLLQTRDRDQAAEARRRAAAERE